MNNIEITQADWSTHESELSAIRREVFIEEQQVPEDLEWDGLDETCRHVLAIDLSNNLPVGTGRLLSGGHIGRMAIRKNYRRQGIGRRILDELLAMAISDDSSQIILNAQLTAVEFYKQANFNIVGEPFMDANIPHVKMVLDLTKDL